MNFIDKEIEEYAKLYTSNEPELLKELAEFTETNMPMAQMLTGKIEGRLLKMLVALTGAKSILEIGMFTGYSALSLAEAMPEDGRLLTCDIDEEVAKLAKEYFARSPHGSKITVKLGPALETLSNTNESFDLVFLDADKENYVEYYQSIIPKLNSNGLLVIDNCLWSGKVLEPEAETDIAIHKLNQLIVTDHRVENVVLTIRDGVNLVRKL
ncbi:methyltransferase [Kangiella profundi]|uniref:Methyltransferase n=1 Tax=Kangiella profundi TaxID=1561924 RepID=A0A2K9AI54_9GAMM|nr:class I SAM-dependent methyltransferase [Kangiella profundi]AUD78624.1 methyltransferase [Kangiella profundi]GGF09543.1 O-methyltransferase [Kangiella profundi]